MPCKRKKPTYKKKKSAQRHGAITCGSKKYRVRKVKGGYRAYEK